MKRKPWTGYAVTALLLSGLAWNVSTLNAGAAAPHEPVVIILDGPEPPPPPPIWCYVFFPCPFV